MRILINAISAKMGGFKTLINSFIENIDEDDEKEYHFLVYKDSINRDLIYKKNVKIIESNVGDMNHIRRVFWYQFELPKIIKNKKYDYMINFTNYGPVFPGCKQILLLHNSKHISNEIKETFNFNQKLKLKIQDFILWLSLIGSDKLVVQTNYMKKGVVEKFKYKSENIFIIPNAPVALDNKSIDKNLEYAIDEFIGNEKNVISDITLYAKHKNLELLLRAIKYIKEKKMGTLKLILTIDGSKGDDTKRLISMIDELEIQDYVFSVGSVKHENIHQILNKTKLFVFPSYAESFGIPFVEAMKFGLPIVAADLGFAHDVCGKAAIYFKYNDVEELAKCIIKVLEDDELRNQMKIYSLEQGSKYQEKDIVKEYIRLLN
ncbi:glycosyltransferase family 4 protein [Clostridium tertium]